jgi:hypothetical protein
LELSRKGVLEKFFGLGFPIKLYLTENDSDLKDAMNKINTLANANIKNQMELLEYPSASLQPKFRKKELS